MAFGYGHVTRVSPELVLHLLTSTLHRREDCKEPLPAPGNRSNEKRYKEKDLARTGEKKLGTREERVTKKAGVVKSRHG
ncbi:hypothetical protein TNCV_3679381 [Trichonephila clavipes]|nr:hypothetical protein TNCV_3679381 [Trichonephila clavipes]